MTSTEPAAPFFVTVLFPSARLAELPGLPE